MSISDWIPEPTIILLGCQAWTAVSAKPGQCPVCGPGVRDGDDSIHCAKCDSSSPRREKQIRAARAGLKARDRAETRDQAYRDDLKRKTQAVLTESERRRYWNGAKGGFLAPAAEPTNRAKAGRDWLVSIGQEPDWSLILDGRGNVVGRFEPEPEPLVGSEVAFEESLDRDAELDPDLGMLDKPVEAWADGPSLEV